MGRGGIDEGYELLLKGKGVCQRRRSSRWLTLVSRSGSRRSKCDGRRRGAPVGEGGGGGEEVGRRGEGGARGPGRPGRRCRTAWYLGFIGRFGRGAAGLIPGQGTVHLG